MYIYTPVYICMYIHLHYVMYVCMYPLNSFGKIGTSTYIDRFVALSNYTYTDI